MSKRRYTKVQALLPTIEHMIEVGMSHREIEAELGLEGDRPVHNLLKRQRRKATIYRAMNGTTDPSARLVQSIEAAVQYAPAEPDTLPPSGCSNEEYTDYLRTTIIRREAEYQRHILQLQTHYSILNRQNCRVILVMGIAITVLVVFLVGWLIFDIMHPEIGWIQR